MKNLTRRGFLKQTTIATAGLGLASNIAVPAWANPQGANSDIRVAVVGIRSKGKNHVNDLSTMKGVRLVALCDIDPEILNERAAELKGKNISVKKYADVRKLLNDKEIDAVVIATPNHWHAPITIWACQAGKDVYVEKPVCHNVWEGQQMVKAARKYKRIVQSGTQARSNKDIPALIDYIKEGNIGKIRWIHGLWYKQRESIGLVDPYYPENVNYDLFCGPSPMVPLRRNRLHYDWHWKWDTGNGDLCNLGVHIFDVARWIAGYDTLPGRIMSLGGRFVVDDAGQTPNTQLTIFDYPEIPIILENRGLPMKPEVRAMDSLKGIREGVVVQCEGGYYAGYHGGWIWDNNGKRMKQLALGGAESHMSNFIDCVRSRKLQKLRAPIETGYKSTAACLYGNISYCIGGYAPVDTIKNKLKNRPLALKTFNSLEQHLKVNAVNLEKTPFSLGPWLSLKATQEKISAIDDSNNPELLSQANLLVKDVYRPPFKIMPQD
jgi:predicted dehydrogenase